MEQLSFFMPENNAKSNKQTIKSNKVLHCLWNGEYGEHDLSHINGLEHVLLNQRKVYPQYLGIVIGDFTVVDVEYDWGKRDQRWKIKCNICGEESYRYHTGDWRRGKGGKTTCHCVRDAEKTASESSRRQRAEIINEEIGKRYGRFEVIDYKGFDTCKVRCTICGAVRSKGIKISKLRDGEYPVCDCGKPRYGDPKWIGARVGHLTVMQHAGHYFLCKCDCGRERPCTDSYFAQGRYLDCGSPECKYIAEQRSRSIGAKIRGNSYEAIASAIIESAGYKVKHVGKTGDFGVDIIATDWNGMKIAVQCKSNTRQTIGVEAIQQVYAGGRYYGLERFAVIGHSGYSTNAVKMAKKLGVYLSDGQSFAYPEDMLKYTNTIVPTYNAQKHIKARKLYEMDGVKKTLADWAFEYGTTEDYIRKGLQRGLSMENALRYSPYKKRKEYTLNGETGTLAELAQRYQPTVTLECVRSRIRNGMTVEEAFFTPSRQLGRPKKSTQINTKMY